MTLRTYCILLYEQPLLVSTGSGRGGDMTTLALGVTLEAAPPKNTDLNNADLI